ncbi:MAG: hypothetical protein LBS19_03090 [Clostridiales bacterium]|nr:hypothetical protein [Clostridiales bacterium]
MFGNRADGFTQRVNAGRAVKIEYCLEVLVLKEPCGVYAATGHQSVSRADRKSLPERQADIVFVIFPKETAFGGVLNIPLVILIIARGKVMCKAHKHISKIPAEIGKIENLR